MRRFPLLLHIGFLVVAGAGPGRAELKPETMAAFQQYVASQEKRIESQSRSEKDFLWAHRDAARRSAIQQGEIPVENLSAPEIPSGMIQHWVGGMFVPNTTLDKVIKLDQSYARHKILYQPDIVDSKILSQSGNQFQIFYRFKKQKVLTVVLDTVHDVEYVPLRPKKIYVRSRCNRVREVKNPGEPSEKALPEGKDQGFLWAMNSYWRMEERDGGVLMECEAITLARSIPQALVRMVGPIINSFAEESLTNTLTSKKRVIAETR